MINSFADLEERIGITFKDKELLKQALTHRSFLNEHPDLKLKSNERLEFLGDAVLGFLISTMIFQKFPNLAEGDLAVIRSRIVRKDSLAKIGERLGLGQKLLLSKGEEAGGGRKNKSLLENSVEALIGAIFLDTGLEKAEFFVGNYLGPLINLVVSTELKDSKSLLQEKVQEEEKLTPHYRILGEVGPDHAKLFTVGVFAGKKRLAEGKGVSKQLAEEDAAATALEKLSAKNTLEY